MYNGTILYPNVVIWQTKLVKNTQFGFVKELIFAITLTIKVCRKKNCFLKKEIYLEKVVSVSQATSHTHQW